MRRIVLVVILFMSSLLVPQRIWAICSNAPCFYLESSNGTGLTSDPISMAAGDIKSFIIFLNNDRGVVADTDKISAFQVELAIPSNLDLMVDSSTLLYFPYDHGAKYSKFRRSLLDDRYQEWIGGGAV